MCERWDLMSERRGLSI